MPQSAPQMYPQMYPAPPMSPLNHPPGQLLALAPAGHLPGSSHAPMHAPLPPRVPPGEEAAFSKVLEDLGHTFYDETGNKIYTEFMR